MKKKISRRRFLSGALMLLFSAVATVRSTELSGKDNTEQPVIGRTTRKKADYARELAG